MENKQQTEEQLIERARQWVAFHAKEETRDKMDEVLEGLTEADQRRVTLCGQRLSGGLPPRIAA